MTGSGRDVKSESSVAFTGKMLFIKQTGFSDGFPQKNTRTGGLKGLLIRVILFTAKKIIFVKPNFLQQL